MQLANPALFRLRDADGVQRLEDQLLFQWDGRQELPHHIEDLANTISRALFGIVRTDVFIDWADFDDVYEHQIYLQMFETSELDDFDSAEFLKGFGLDFTSSSGQPLRCTRFLKLQAEAAGKGYFGHRPDREAARLSKLATSLERDAASFLATKRKPSAQ